MANDAQVSPIPPSVMWAQRYHSVFLTICLEDCKDPKVDIQPDSIYFYGIGGTDKKAHELKIDLYANVDPNGSKVTVMDRTIEILLKKPEDGPFWPRLTKEKNKYHWLKINFSKWKDESDSESEGEDNLEDMMKSMGNLGGSTGDAKEYGDGDVPLNSDSDAEEEEEEEIPELE